MFKTMKKTSDDKPGIDNEVLIGEETGVVLPEEKAVGGKKKKEKKIKEKQPKVKKEKLPKEKAPKDKQSAEADKKKNLFAGMKKKFSERNENDIKEEEGKKEKKQSMLFSLRNKIFISFLIPILFMIVVGYTAYHYAAEGMSEKFTESTQQTTNMTMNYLDMNLSYIQAEGFRYASDNSYENYFLGMMNKDKAGRATFINTTKVTLLASQKANNFIDNIHFITRSKTPIISTGVTSQEIDGIYEVYFEEMVAQATDGKNPDRWIDSHPMLDEHLELTLEDYFMTFQMPTTNKFAYIVMDVRKSAVQGILADLDLGNGSITGFVTKTGKEVVSEVLEEGQTSHFTEGEIVFADKDFYASALASEELSGAMEVTFKGVEYLYLFNKSEVCDIILCALIPKDIITGQAESIKTITITLVIIATIAAVLIGSFITFGIQKNMKNISKKLNEVAEGNLTVKVRAQSRDEFNGLAKTATHMISNNKKLVTKLTGTVEQLEQSAGNVNTASENISNYSGDITRAIDEISQGLNKQAEHAQECVVKTSILSEKIQDINQMVEEVETLVDQTEKMIEQGTKIVQILSERAQETSAITARVGDSIAVLKTESETINGFAQTISGISSQTNLLSLNASIEAARAGEAGRGFAVVAEEIRKLADDSNKAANEISRNVQNISVQTASSVSSAKEAEEMVALQTQAVTEVIQVFEEMSKKMAGLFVNLKEIANNTEAANKEKEETLDAVENISAIIEETASGSALVREMANELLKSVDKLSETASALDDDMQGLKTEISVFKID